MTPRATYRLQFNDVFTFADACAIVPYLAGLGISHVYASPILSSRSGSSHGYDGVDPTRVRRGTRRRAGPSRFCCTIARPWHGADR